MIYDGVHGYVRGDLNQPSGTELAMTKGPIKGRNWNYASTNPAYSITIRSIDGNPVTGTVKLQGTNDVAIREDRNSNIPVETDLLPSEGASWVDIQAGTSVSVTGTFATEYQFLRLAVGTQGNGCVTQAWVRWT